MKTSDEFINLFIQVGTSRMFFLPPATSAAGGDFEISRLARPEFDIFISLTKYVAILEQQVAKKHNIDGPIFKY